MRALLLLALVSSIFGQTTVSNRTDLGAIDDSGAASTKPIQAGSSLPATCGSPQLFYLTTATAGKNLYSCTSTNTWTLQSGAGGGSVFTGSTVLAPNFSATPTFSLADVSVKSPVRFEPGVLTANVTVQPFTNKTAGALFEIAWKQDPTGGRMITYGMDVVDACVAIHPGQNVTTTQSFVVASDGTTVKGTGCVDNSLTTKPCAIITGSPSGVTAGTVGDCVFQSDGLSGQKFWMAIASGTPATWELEGSNSGGSSTLPVTVTTSSSVTITSGTSGVYYNESATAGAGVTYNLPPAVAGLEECVGNAYNGSAANTGMLEMLPSGAGQYIIGASGVLTVSPSGYVISSGAAVDYACVKAIDSTHWILTSVRGSWANGTPSSSITYINHGAASNSGFGAVTTAGINMTGANFVAMNCGTGNTTATPSDSLSNTWTTAIESPAVSQRSHIFIAVNATTGPTQTFTCTPAAGAGNGVEVAGFSNVATSGALDQTASANAAASAIQAGSVTPTTNNQLLIAGVGLGFPFIPTIGSGFSITDTDPGQTSAMAFSIQTTATAANPTWVVSFSTNLGASIATIK